MKISVSVQMFTLRDETSKDFIGTLEKVASIGYHGVEFAGFGDIPAAKMKETLDRLGLKATGSHTGMDLLKNNFDEVVDYNLAIGNKNIIIPWANLDTKKDFEEMARDCKEVGEKLRAKGLQLFYHNHDFEFKSFDGVYGLEIIYNNAGDDSLKAEVDTYWVQSAGVNPSEFIRKHSGKCGLIHLKDMEAGESKAFAEVGEGIMDIRSIIEAGVESGAEWFVVEQDVCKRPALESIAISFSNLKKMGVV